jgi:hypothetical protein
MVNVANRISSVVTRGIIWVSWVTLVSGAIWVYRLVWSKLGQRGLLRQ